MWAVDSVDDSAVQMVAETAGSRVVHLAEQKVESWAV